MRDLQALVFHLSEPCCPFSADHLRRTRNCGLKARQRTLAVAVPELVIAKTN